MQHIIRPAKETDAPAICEIANEIIRTSLITFTTIEKSPGDMAQTIALAEHPFLVAEKDGDVLGFATYGPFRSGPGYRFTAEHSINLAPAARGLGIGRDLMQALEQAARHNGIHALIAGISGANPNGVAFHAAIGFTHVGHLPETGFKFNQWLDVIFMQKILPPV